MTVERVAITGGSGFIGSRLAELVAGEGVAVRTVDIVDPPSPSPGQPHRVDIRDAGALSRALEGCSTVCHLAAVHRDDVRPASLYDDVNVTGTANLVAAAEANAVTRIVFTSTVAVYGLGAGTAREDSAPQPFNAYGRSKLAGEEILRGWLSRDARRSLVILRLVATFGAGNRGNIHTLISQISSGRFVMVGSGRNRKSIAYVGNVAAFLNKCRECGPGLHSFNYADKPDLTTEALVAQIRDLLGQPASGPRIPFAVGMSAGLLCDTAAWCTRRSFPISAQRVRKFCAETVVSVERARAIGFVPPFSLHDGLREMVQADFARMPA